MIPHSPPAYLPDGWWAVRQAFTWGGWGLIYLVLKLIQTISYSNKLIELELKGKAAFSNNEKLLSEVCEIVAKLEEYVK